MDILQENNENKGRFYIEIDGNKEAEMTYTWAGTSRVIIDHTEVNEVLRGQNAGKLMVLKAVEFAREKNIKIVPLCPFANSVFKKNVDIQDVL
jgi:predicted GNAT family acetyltransferase